MNIISEQSRMASDLRIFRKVNDKEAKKVFRVAAYCRVSTDMKIQESSLETQMSSFYRRINENPDWTLVGIYSDKGISGTSAKCRVEFQRLIKDAEDGKIDYILAKSISRFARNTVDALFYTRKLKQIGVGVYFEEQALDTLSATSEIFLTIYAAFAQEESHSFSENMKRGIRERFALGVPKWSETYGYRNENGEWHIDEDEALVVREIYRLYTEGLSLPKIRAELEIRNIKPPKRAGDPDGKCIWWEHTIAAILHNEKYIGDVEMQKSYTVDCLTHKRVSNDDATIPKYYKKGHHERIIDDETFALARTILAMRDKHGGGIQYPFFGYLKCPLCGADMLRLRLPTRKFEPAWFCRDKCALYAIKDKYIHTAVMNAYEITGKSASGNKVEYKFLYDNVRNISFKKHKNKVDWSTLSVTWKNGKVSFGKISYEIPSDIPCTRIEEKNDRIVIDGEMLTKRSSARSCIERVAKFIADTEICGERDIPVVITPNSAKAKKVIPEKGAQKR